MKTFLKYHASFLFCACFFSLSGLGFNIVGGVDLPYVLNDNGIFVSKIKKDGMAAMDGRLQEGDKILAVAVILKKPSDLK